MKKIFRNLMAVAIAAMTFSACEDVPAPYDVFDEEQTNPSVTIDPQGTGTQADPFNVAAAIAKAKEIGSEANNDKYYVKGICVVSGAADATYGNASFYIADNTDGDRFYCFQVLGTGGKKMAAGYTINEGDEVVIYGPIYNYKGNTPETAGKGAASIVTINGKATNDSGSVVPSGEAKGSGTEADPFNVAAAIAKCQAIGQTAPNEKYYVKGICVVSGVADATYGNASFYIADTPDGDKFYCFQVLGTNGQKMPAGYAINEGDEVVIYGPIYNYKGNTPETAGKGAANIVTINGKATSDNGGETPVTPTDGATAVSIAEFNAAAESTDVWYQLTGTVKNLKDGDQYGNFDLEDETGSVYVYGLLSEKGGAKKKFQELVAAKGIKEGSKITIIGNRGSFNDKIEVMNAYFVSIEGEGGSEGGQQGGGETVSSLTNGDFETWSEGLPTGWKSASTASSATLEQSTDAHGGSYACIVKGNESQNKRLASQEITLAAGSYTFSFWVKATSENKAQVRPGYVPVTNGSVGSYSYSNDYANISTSWSQVSYDFTLDTETTVCLVVMNPKSGSYSSGEDVIIDDAVLTKK